MQFLLFTDNLADLSIRGIACSIAVAVIVAFAVGDSAIAQTRNDANLIESGSLDIAINNGRVPAGFELVGDAIYGALTRRRAN